MGAVPEVRGGDAVDERLAAGIRAGDAGAQDELTRRLRPMLERVCARVAEPGDAEDLVALVLYEMLQAEGRLVAAWDRAAPLDAYLALVVARACLEEHRRFQVIRERGADSARPEADPGHPSESSLACALVGRASQEVRAHVAECPRCARRLELARCALEQG